MTQAKRHDFAAWSDCARRGDFAAAWRINEQIGQHWPSAHQLWQRRSGKGKTVTVRFLHGLGDAVQMMQYAPLLAARGVSARFDLPAPLCPLLPFFKVGGPPDTQAEKFLEVEAMELPFLFRTGIKDLPLAQNYLQLPAWLLSRSADRMGPCDRPRVGLVWSGSDWDRERWVPLASLRPLTERRDIEIWNLQHLACKPSGVPPQMRYAEDVCGSGLDALAATIANLDLLVTVDTLAAHLGGALGVPTIVLLKYDADWRWMTGERTPWYPSLKLVRQPVPGAWDAVLAQLEIDLTQMVQAAQFTEETQRVFA